jgi:hypothetical protein
MKRVSAIIPFTIAIISLLVFFNIYQFYQISLLQKSNDEYQLRLNEATKNFSNLEEENERSKISNVTDVSANIVTRLGAKLFQGGVKDIYGTISNYVWMTGEVQNIGTVPAFVSLSIRISTTKGVEIQEVILGTLQPNQIVQVTKTIWPEQGEIASWTITPRGYYFP